MAKKEELLDLAKRESDALLDAEIAAQERTAETDLDNKTEIDALSQSHRDMADAQAAYNQAQYQNMGQIIGDIQGKIDTAKQDDETATRRENAYRYISGLGDTLSSLANLVGTAHGAANQKQTYNSSKVVEKAEAARKARKLEMEELSKRLDEMKTKQRELKASGSLEEAKMKFQHDKEMAALLADQRKAKLEADRYADTRADKAMRDAREDWQKERTFQTQLDQFNKTYNLQLAKFNEETKSNSYNFTLADGSFEIPKEKLNDVNIERIFNMLPEEIRATVKGKQTTVYETDDMGNTVRKTGNEAPTMAQKLAAIGAYADSNEKVKNELYRLAGKTVPKSEQPKEDFSKYIRTTPTPTEPTPAATPQQSSPSPRIAGVTGQPVLAGSARSEYQPEKTAEIKKLMGI